MPYTVAKNGPDDKPFCIYKRDADGNPTGETLGCHATQDEAGAQIGAIEANEGKSVKAVGDWELDVLGVPYGSATDKDSDGEWFDAQTHLHEDKFPLPPAVYYHGKDAEGGAMSEPAFIGRTAKRWVDQAGVWFRVVLDKGNEYAKRVWDAAQQGIARASSGAVGHLVRTDADGHIREWPMAELSIFDAGGARQPSNRHAIALPAMKALYQAAGLALPSEIDPPEAEPEAAKAAATAAGQGPTTEQGVKTMDEKELKKAIADAIAEVRSADATKADKAVVDGLTAKVDTLTAELAALKAEKPLPAGGVVTVVVAAEDRPFKTYAEQCKSVLAWERRQGESDPRLKRLAVKATGANEAVPSQGGFLLDPTLTAGFLKPVHEEGPFSKMVSMLPVAANSNSGWLNGVDETNRATGSRWGGIRGYRLGEADLKTGSKPKFRRINWELKKSAVLVYSTDELLADAGQFAAVVDQGAREELSFMVNDDILNGAGANGPLGILQSGCLISQAIEAGQLADTVVHENLEHMWARMLPRSRSKAAWFINSEVEPFLDMLLIAGGAGVLEPRFVSYGPTGILSIKGRPVYVTEFNSAIGDLGDIVLADMSEYLFWEKGGIESAVSIHVLFIYDETVFRFVYRCDGQPARAAALTPYKGSATQSPFVTLAAR